MSIHVYGLPNTVDAQADEHGWTVIPFGLWPHSAGYQRFGMREAENIVSAFKSVCGRLKRAIVGPPVYKGHPDNPAMANEFPDKTRYGLVADMEVRDGGLAIRHILSDAGAALVSKLGLDRISPNWFVEDTGERKNDRKVYAPTAIKSIGLTKKPNIPNLSLANERDTEPMKDLLIKLLALANEATDEQIVAAVTALSKRPEPSELANARNDLAVANGKVGDLTAKLDSEKARADAGATALANERRGQIDGLLANSIREGKIPAADKDKWRKILEADLDSGRTVLANIKATVKVKSQVEGRTLADADRHAREQFANGGDDGDGNQGDGAALDGMANRGAKIQKMVNAEMVALGHHQGMTAAQKNTCRNTAWGNVKKHMPSLFSDGAQAGDDHEDDSDKPTAAKKGPQKVHKDTTQA